MVSRLFLKEGTMNESDKSMLSLVINTLNSISVKGKDNLDMLLGSIIALEKLLNGEKEDTENG